MANIEEIHALATTYLKPDKSGKGYICPICQSGSGRKGTGITTQDGIHFTCWAGGCFTNADIIDIIALEKGITEPAEKLKAACEALGIRQDDYTHTHTHTHKEPEAEIKQKPKQEPETDYTNFFLEANKNLDKTDYHRGISLETLNKYKVGYVEEWKNPKAPNSKPTPRLIIPTSKYSYLARDTRTELTEEEEGYAKQKVGSVHLFNSKALENATQPIHIVEGEIDALSIIDVGGEAIALGSTSNIGKFTKAIEEKKPKQPLIIMLDNDEAGRKADEKLCSKLKELNILYYSTFTSTDKDANEVLLKYRDVLKEFIKYNEREAKELILTEKDKLQKEAAAYSINALKKEIERNREGAFASTGIAGLDDILDGGLYPGLYIIGAVSSAGKTTLACQMMDEMARAGKKVLYFSLEMARTEIMAKSISRLTFLLDRKNGMQIHAKTTRGILNGYSYDRYDETERDIINEAFNEYGKFAQNIWITEGTGNISVKDIRAKTEQFIRIYEEKPIVIIDYAQIIAPYSERLTDKQNTDKAILELKRLSRDYSIPVVAISSFNRESYTAPVNMTAFKESGAIEYGSDVLIGMQYEGMDYKEGETDKERDKRIRNLFKENENKAKDGIPQNIQLKVLKNRNGRRDSVNIDLYLKYNCFIENENQFPDDEEDSSENIEKWDGFTDVTEEYGEDLFD